MYCVACMYVVQYVDTSLILTHRKSLLVIRYDDEYGNVDTSFLLQCVIVCCSVQQCVAVLLIVKE